jgi:HAD superfamily hydrolase (TIGR01459 family)
MTSNRPVASPRGADAIPTIAGLGALAGRYDAILCDIWGVLHNGRNAFPAASEALAGFRRGGGTVILLTNAPRPNPPIREQTLAFGVAAEAFDEIVTSGDVTIDLIAARAGQPLHHLGPERDLALIEAAALRAGQPAQLVPPQEAAYVLCTGLFDDTVETPADYAATLAALAERRLPMVCANPDLVVQRGDKLIYCGGAIAEAYEALGGETIYAGKPHPPIYEAALARIAALRGGIARSRVLAIGDALRTDLAGAAAMGLDALFVIDGIHADALCGSGAPPDALQRLLAPPAPRPIAAIRALAP